jgi:DNA-binding transcriptional regulator PaaX
MKATLEKTAALPISRYTPEQLAWAILKYTATGIFIAGVLVCPNLIQVYDAFQPKDEAERRRIRRGVSRLQSRGYIRQNSQQLNPTQLGMRRMEYEQARIQTATHWDGRWRLCMFDIPESNKRSRRVFSIKISSMGMRKYQKSIYISPYACDTELAKVARYLRVEKFVRLVTAEKITDELHFKRLFNI